MNLEKTYAEAVEYLKNDLTKWKTSYEGCQYIESTIKVSNTLEKDIPYFFRHLKQTAPKAIIFIFHGISESSLFYGGIGSKFGAENYEVFAPDMQGHGKSHGHKNPDCSDYNILYQNAWSFVFKMMAANYEKVKDLPIFFMGVALGGAMTLEMQINFPKNFKGNVAGLIILSAPIIIGDRPPSTVESILKFSSYILPNFSVRKMIPQHNSRVPEVHELWNNTPEKFQYIPSTFGRETCAMADHLVGNLNKLTTPTLLLQGSDDRVVDKKGAQLFSDTCSNVQDFTFVEYVDASHMILQDYVVLEVEKKILDWISKRIKK